MPVLWWMRLDLVFLVGRTTSGGVFFGISELIMILGSLSANGLGFSCYELSYLSQGRDTYHLSLR